jgi:prepilin-type N-terminal cleavage/methylation domain-containing protein
MRRRGCGVAATAGFTLIEVLISISLFALVAGICYAAFHLGIRAVAKGEGAVVTAQRLRVATDVLIRQVKSAAAAPACVDGDTYPYFEGSPTKMSFVTDAGQLLGGGRSFVTYGIGSDAQCAALHATSPCLVLDETSEVDCATLGGKGTAATERASAAILDGFRSLALEYCSLEESEDHCNWKSTWSYVDEETLPPAVRITIEGLPGMDEDVFGQEIPIMTAQFAEPDELTEPQECDQLEGGSQTGTGSSSKTPGQTGGKGDEADDEGDGGENE